jgi:hypothetical protein
MSNFPIHLSPQFFAGDFFPLSLPVYLEESYQSHVPLTSSNNFSFQDIYGAPSARYLFLCLSLSRSLYPNEEESKSVSFLLLVFPFFYIILMK